MASSFLPIVNKEDLEQSFATLDAGAFFTLLCDPLHEELYKRQDFAFMDTLSEGQQCLLAYDYARMQTEQGGFIQLLHNGYGLLLLTLYNGLNLLELTTAAKTIDDVLKVFSLNFEHLSADLGVDDFARLYEEYKEFEPLDAQFEEAKPAIVKALMEYASKHSGDFCVFA